MRCPNCHSENPENASFCIECGAAFERHCLKCAFENPPRAKFCSRCGSSFTEAAIAADGEASRPDLRTNDDASSVRGGHDGERRHLTVLFSDLVGSTAIAARLDPEEWREALAGFHRVAAEAITRFEGHVAKYLGDGVMAYFGWPAAHDNDAERAARAGLAILDAIAKLNEQPGQVKLATRVGIDSGTVVIGRGAGNEAEVFGDPPNIAAKVQAAAASDTVAVTDTTHRLMSGLFVVEDLGAQSLKGLESPLQLYRVVRPSGVRGRFQAATAAGGLTPFVGREDELRSLTSRWQRVLDSDGQVALIIGEAGIGKSRLVQRFHQQIAGTAHLWIEAGAGALYQSTPFYPVTEMLRHALFAGGDGSSDAIAQLAGALSHAGVDATAAVPLLAPLLNLPLPPEYPPSQLPPDQQRRRLLATLVEWVLGSARTQPLVIVIEDLHWADPSTLELIQLLGEQGATAKLLLLYTARPEFHGAGTMRAHHAQITLNRLGARDIRTMVAEVAASRALTDETVATVIERTGGVPLFVEELTRAVLENSDAKLTVREIPATLHDSLMARLDRLGPAKEVIQVGAVIGSEFSYELLHAVHPIGDRNLQEALTRLTETELLYVRGIAPDATYQFKHALIRDAAYEALLKSRRKELHLIVAQTIDKKFPTIKEAHPEVLARHWTEAGEIERAITEWSHAGKAAESRGAFPEALESYHRALSQLEILSASPERDRRELELRQSVIWTLYVTKSHASAEAIAATERAAVLAESGGNLSQLVISLFSRGLASLIAGDLLTGLALEDQALILALRDSNPAHLGVVRVHQMLARSWVGDLVGVEDQFSAGLEFFENADFRRFPGAAVGGFGFASLNAWTRGYSEVALQREAEMRSAANENNPYDMALAQGIAGWLRIYCGKFEQAEALAQTALQISEGHQISQVGAASRCILGQARAQLGNAQEGIALLRKGIDGLLGGGTRLGLTREFTYLAHAQQLNGALAEALETVENTLKMNPEELLFRPETMRVRGEIQLKLGKIELAETDFREAIVLAQSMSAKAWELRATTSLARLFTSLGRRDEARTMLAAVYNWFTEGFDTADLIDAKKLLEELAG